MFEYIVKKSFWVHPGSKINWDTEKYGREGVGIPLILLEKHQRISVVVEDRGKKYMLETGKALDHEAKWNTAKTAPIGTPKHRLFVIIPVGIMNFEGFTQERIIKEKETKKEEKSKNDDQLTIF